SHGRTDGRHLQTRQKCPARSKPCTIAKTSQISCHYSSKKHVGVAIPPARARHKPRRLTYGKPAARHSRAATDRKSASRPCRLRKTGNVEGTGDSVPLFFPLSKGVEAGIAYSGQEAELRGTAARCR